MSSIAGQNTSTNSARESKIPIPKSNANTNGIREDPLTNKAMKPPFETRKSGEDLKLRLASAMSAKIALNKDGRNSTSNRGIGFLLQRKEQQENKLKTKDISFQKPVRNGTGKAIETTANAPIKGIINGINKTELQKSLLSALMNTRGPSGTKPSQNRNSGELNLDKTSPRELIKTQLSKALSQNAAKESQLMNGKRSKENGIKSTINIQTKNDGINGLTKAQASRTTREKAASESLTKSSNNTDANGILDRAKKIERLLGQRKPLKSNEKDVEPKGAILNTSTRNMGEISIANKTPENGKTSAVLSRKDEQDSNVRKIVNTSSLLDSLKKDGNVGLNGKFDGDVRLESTPKLIENATVNGKSNGMFKTVDKRAPLEAFGKKIPPPVAKKPSKEEMQKTKQDSQLPRQSTAITSQNNPLKIIGKSNVLKANNLKPKTEKTSDMSSRQDIEFREDLLDKLEANVASSKIAAFQSIEDFSVLRMKIYRLRGELDQLKKDREKRMSLVC